MGMIARQLGVALGAVLLLNWPAEAGAGGVERLRAFLDQTRTARAAFSQTVIGKSGRKPQQASGDMVFSRPGRFRWTYDKPYHQLLVGDGERLWIYDRDLNQVSVRKLGGALGSSPAALLAGDNTLERNFNLRDGGSRDGLEWVEAQPKNAESSFEQVSIGFSGDVPQRMELRDAFGQTTVLVFSAFERNPRLDAAQFRFVPPAGADVVGGD